MATRKLRMLAACEMSGRVATAFARRGWEAWSADLLPSESPQDGSYRHYQGDCRDLFSWGHPVNAGRMNYANAFPVSCDLDGSGLRLWDLVIAFPPCTDLALAGAVWWKAKRADGRQDAAAAFFMKMAGAPSQLVAVENPRGDMTRRYRPPDQYVQPYMFGDPVIKATGLWLKGLPLLEADNLVSPGPGARVATGGGSYRTDKRNTGRANNAHEDSEGRARRSVVRSRTLPGLARAMASQWGSFAERYYSGD